MAGHELDGVDGRGGTEVLLLRGLLPQPQQQAGRGGGLPGGAAQVFIAPGQAEQGLQVGQPQAGGVQPALPAQDDTGQVAVGQEGLQRFGGRQAVTP